MCRKAVLILSVWLFLAAAEYASAQNIAVVYNPKIKEYIESIEGVKEVLSHNGYAPGYDYYDSTDSGYLSRLGAKKYDVIHALTTAPTVAVRDKFPAVAVVFSMVVHPVEEGVVSGMESPGGNLTGIALHFPVEKDMGLVRKILPQARKVGIIYSRLTRGEVDRIKKMAPQFDLEIVARQVSSAIEVPQAFNAMSADIDIFWMILDNIVYNRNSLAFLLKDSMQKGVPVMGFSDNMVKAGALFSPSYDFKEIGKQAGEMMVKILNGTAAEDIPVVVPRRQNYVINLKTAQYLKIDIPADVIRKAAGTFK